MRAFGISKVYALLEAYKTGKLGGKKSRKMRIRKRSFHIWVGTKFATIGYM